MECGASGENGAFVINHVTTGQYKENDIVTPQSHNSMENIASVKVCKETHATSTNVKVCETAMRFANLTYKVLTALPEILRLISLWTDVLQNVQPTIFTVTITFDENNPETSNFS